MGGVCSAFSLLYVDAAYFQAVDPRIPRYDAHSISLRGCLFALIRAGGGGGKVAMRSRGDGGTRHVITTPRFPLLLSSDGTHMVHVALTDVL